VEQITTEEKVDFRNFLVKLYGQQANSWQINNKVLDLIEEIILKSEGCTKYIHAVPRPSNINPAGTVKKWAFKQARRALARYLNKADKH